jgi:bla regulator protein blaR1
MRMAGKKYVIATGVLAAAALGVTAGLGQAILHANGPLPKFEVATVKLMNPEAVVSLAAGAATGGAAAAPALTPGGEKIIRQTSVRVSYGDEPVSDRVHMRWKAKMLIEIAYGLPIGSELRVVGGPDWIDSDADRYEIQAKIDNAIFAEMQKMPVKEQGRQINLMQQALLADRFNLKVHFETRDLPVYALVVAKGGPKMAEAKPDEVSRLTGTGDGQNNVLEGQALTMTQLVRSPLLRPDARMVVDQTGLTGKYDFTLRSATGMDPSADGPSLFSAVEQQLGLKLVSTKARVEVIVVDHMDRPGDN